MTIAEQLAAENEAHDRYHDSGMCYGDSHAMFRQKIERLERLLAAEAAPPRASLPLASGVSAACEPGGENR